MTYVIFASGLALLILCGDALVRGAVALAVRLSIPTLVTGLTIVAFGTSAPELVVSLRAALTDAPGIAIGNVVGSNIANVLLVLGLPAIIAATNCNQPFIERNMIYTIGASLLFITLCFLGPLSFWHGFILFTLMILFLIESGRRAAKSEEVAAILSEDTLEMIDSNLPKKPLFIGLLMITGLIGLPLGAHLTVDGATDIARTFGVSEAVIGLTVVAIGTSLPELVTTVIAAIRGQCGLALGNVLGSNLFNLLAIMGLTSMITPIVIPKELFELDLWIMLGATLALTPFVFRRSYITRAVGVLFVFCYAAYIWLAFVPSAIPATVSRDGVVEDRAGMTHVPALKPSP